MAVRNGNRGSNFLFGTFGSDEINGRGGNDWMFGLGGNDIMRGGNGNDLMFGGSGNDRVAGGNGNDLMFGGSGNDRVAGGNGNDIGFGGSGNDRMIGGRGSDLMFGGSGNDTFVYRAERNVGERDFYSGGSGTDRLVIRLNAEEFADESIRTDIAEFETFIESGGIGNFTFESLGLTVNSIERLRVIAPEPEPNENNDPTIDGPVDLGATDEDVAIFVSEDDLLVRASDADGDALSVLGVPVASGDAVVMLEDGRYLITPGLNDDTEVTLTYTITDGQASVVQTATLDLTPVDDAPVPGAPVDLGEVDEFNSITVSIADLLANASDVDSEALAVSIVDVSGGSVRENADGTLNLFARDVGQDGGIGTIDYTISDGTTDVEAQATFTVNDVPSQPPVVSGPVNLGNLEEDGSLFFAFGDLLANASDPNMEPLSVRSLTDQSGGGQFAIGELGITYTPALNFNGPVTIAYEVFDGIFATEATATLEVTPVNDAPTVVADFFELGENETVELDFLANDSDLDGDELSVVSVIANNDVNSGSVTEAGGVYTYTPSPNAVGLSDGETLMEDIAYSISDGQETVVGNITVTVNGSSNAAPTAVDDDFRTIEIGDREVRVIVGPEGETFDVLANDLDPDGDTLEIISVGPVVGGEARIVTNADGLDEIYVRPLEGLRREVEIEYTMSDGEATDMAVLRVWIEDDFILG